MNERIKLLAEQARKYYPATMGSGEYWVFDEQKFAELIVKECAGIAKQTDTHDGDDYKSGRVWAGIDILKHFNVGVEE